jgi:hypothetical protein
MQLIKGLQSGEIPKDSTLFITDIWNFAIMSIPYLNYFGNYKLKIKGVLHAGSFTDTDFVRNMERYYKNFEDSIFDICDEIYVGSEFIKQDLINKRIIDKNKIVVTGLPMDFDGMSQFIPTNHKKTIIFNGRNVDEKQPYLFELLKNRYPEYEYINTHKENLTKKEYYKLLAESRVVVSFALQENFGYGIQEAVHLGCSPVLPNRLAYKEQFDKRFLYDTFDECCEKILNAVENPQKTTALISNNDIIFDKWFKVKSDGN